MAPWLPFRDFGTSRIKGSSGQAYVGGRGPERSFDRAADHVIARTGADYSRPKALRSSAFARCNVLRRLAGSFLPARSIKGQHRKRGAVRIGLSPPAALGRALERAGNALGISPGEHAVVEIECVARPGHARRPPTAAAAARGFTRSTAGVASFFSRSSARHGLSPA